MAQRADAETLSLHPEAERLPLVHRLALVVRARLDDVDLLAELKPDLLQIGMDVLETLTHGNPLRILCEPLVLQVLDVTVEILLVTLRQRRDVIATGRRAARLGDPTARDRPQDLARLRGRTRVLLAVSRERRLLLKARANRQLLDEVNRDHRIDILVHADLTRLRVPVQDVADLIGHRTLGWLLGSEQRPVVCVRQRLLVVDIVPPLVAPEVGEELIHAAEERTANALLNIRTTLQPRNLDVNARAGDLLAGVERRVALLKNVHLYGLGDLKEPLGLLHVRLGECDDLPKSVLVVGNLPVILEVKIYAHLTNGRGLLGEEARDAATEVLAVELVELLHVVGVEEPLLAILKGPQGEGLA